MNILYIALFNPMLDVTGVTLRGRVFLNFLAGRHSIHLVYMEGSGHHVSQDIIDKSSGTLDSSIKYHCIPFSKWSYFFFSGKLYQKSCEILKQEAIDCVITDYGLSAIYGLLFKKKYNVPYVYLTCNTEYLEYLKRVPYDLCRLPLVPYVYFIEKMGCQRASLVSFISRHDQRRLGRWVEKKRHCYIPQGFYSSYENPFYKYFSSSRYILFYGSLKSQDNYEACRIICREIMPALNKKYEDLTCLIIGQDPPENIFSHPGVKYLGFVTDLDQYVRNACCVIVPITLGGGMSTKTVKGLALGKHVIATPKACDWAEEIHPLLHIGDIKEFPEMIEKVINKEEYTSSEGFDAMKKIYSWEENLSRFDKELQTIVQGSCR